MKKIFVVPLCVLLLLLACSCKKDVPSETEETGTQTEINYDEVSISDCVSRVEYKNLNVTLTGDNAADGEAIWNAVYESAEISVYPADKVDYYFNQAKTSYLYMVDYDFDDYALLLESRGITEEDMRAEARRMVKEDLVFRFVVEQEGIVLTEEEKQDNFDKYADKLAAELGFEKEYIKTKMPEYVYETMLHDKTTQVLIDINKK